MFLILDQMNKGVFSILMQGELILHFIVLFFELGVEIELVFAGDHPDALQKIQNQLTLDKEGGEFLQIQLSVASLAELVHF